MRPSEGRYVRQEDGRTIKAVASALIDNDPELFRVPVDDDGGQGFQELARPHPAGDHRRDAAQNIRPVGDDRAASCQPLQFFCKMV